MQTEESMDIARAPQKPREDGKYILLHEKHPLHKFLHKLYNTYTCNSIDLSPHLFHNSVYLHGLRSNLDILVANFQLLWQQPKHACNRESCYYILMVKKNKLHFKALSFLLLQV